MRHLGKFGLMVGAVLICASPAEAQFLKPHEPLNPAKAQSLPLSPLSIETTTGVVKFQVEVADDDRERSTGLMHRTELPIDRGMLFDFKSPRPVSFWMRNTFIPLDMLFIARDGTIRFIAENTVPHSEQGVGPGNIPILAVLELQGGASAKLGIKPGDKVRHTIFER